MKLSSGEARTLLDVLIDKQVDIELRLSAYRDGTEPGPLDSCCAGHLLRWQARHGQRVALEAQLTSVNQIIERLQHETPTEGSTP